MCDPTTAMLAISAASAGTSYIGGQQNAKATTKAKSKALESSYEVLSENQNLTNQSASLDKSNRLSEGLLERSKLATIAGESGALGLSSDRLVANSLMREGSDITTIEKNRLTDVDSISNQMTQGQRSIQSSINSTYTSAPTLLSTGLQIGSDYARYSATSKANAKKATV